jgi:hypothetical protein
MIIRAPMSGQTPSRSEAEASASQTPTGHPPNWASGAFFDFA